MKKYKLAILTSHPIQYHSPMFKKLAENPQIDLTVYFCLDRGFKGEIYDKDFGAKFKWDIPLLDGFNYKFLKNYSFWPQSNFFGQINLGIIHELSVNNYDAVFVFGWNSLTNWLVFLSKLFHQVPIILRGESNLNVKNSWLKNLIKSFVLKSLFRGVDAFLYSYSLNKDFLMFYGASEEKLFFYPCAVDNERFLNEKKDLIKNRLAFRKKMGFDSKTKIILYTGKLMNIKRPIDLLKAYEILIKNYKFKSESLSLVLVGDGHLRFELEKYVKECNLENVVFAGFKNQSEMSGYYAIADIFAMPSELDISPKSLNEAMLFGLPIVVSSGIGTAVDFIGEKKDKCGFIYDVGDVNAFAGYLKALMEDSSLRKKMGETAFEIVQEWSFENEIKGILSALNFAVNNKNERN